VGFERARDVESHRQTQFGRGRHDSGDSHRRQRRQQAADQLVIRGACAPRGLERPHVRGGLGVDGNQSTEPDEGVCLRVQSGGGQVRAVIRQDLLDVLFVGDRNLAERDLVLLHGNEPIRAAAAALGITPRG
jgi:hypothetical protein